MSACIACVASVQDEDRHDRTRQARWIDTTGPGCDQAFQPGHRVLVDEATNVANHYDCFQGPKRALEAGVVS
ncbi:MAG: hypothetical protein U9R72_12430 [Chloroflexota bacterium]|nr:hypothetical protein [Chloroflexota bacterium]